MGLCTLAVLDRHGEAALRHVPEGSRLAMGRRRASGGALPPRRVVRLEVAHDGEDHLEPLPRHGLQGLLPPDLGAARGPLEDPVVVPPEVVVGAYQGVDGEYQQVLELLVAGPGRRGVVDRGARAG